MTLPPFVDTLLPPSPVRPPELPPNPIAPGPQISDFVQDFLGISPGPPDEPPGPAISAFVDTFTPPNPIRPDLSSSDVDWLVPLK
jgi:hypothetical protein